MALTAAVTTAQDEDGFVLWQAERLHQSLPWLCLAIIACVSAMALAVMGDLPWWQQLVPPLFIVLTLGAVLVWRFLAAPPRSPVSARRVLRGATGVATVLGFVAAGWGINAFIETEQYYCMTAPVFLGLTALISASCLLSVPRAAIAAMVCTLVPLVIKMASYDYIGIRAMAAMTIALTAMQSWIVITNFRQSRRAFMLQRELERVAQTDALTGLANRRAFEERVSSLADDGEPMAVAMLDLNGFKEANDRYGHFVGDCLLAEVARRMEHAAPQAFHARLGGDEFSLVVPGCGDPSRFAAMLDAVESAIARPYRFAEATVCVTTAVGGAMAPQDGSDPYELLRIADERLYVHKRGGRVAERRNAA